MQGRRNRLFEMDNEKKIKLATRNIRTKVDGPGGRRCKGMKITGRRVKIEDRQVWNRIVQQTKTHPGL